MNRLVLSALLFSCALLAQQQQYPGGTGGGGSGDVTDVGDCTGSACFTAAGSGTELVWKNATSGTVTVKTVTGALGTRTISWPAVSGTVLTTGNLYAGSSLTMGVVRDSSTQLTIGGGCSSTTPCNVRINDTTTTYTNDAVLATPTGSGTVWIGLAPNGTRTAWHDITSITTCTNITCSGSATGFPAGSIPLSTCTVTANTFDAGGCTDVRAAYSRAVCAAGTGLQVASGCTFSIGSTVTVFSSGTSAAPGTCTVGERYIKTDTNQEYACTSTNTFTETTGGGGSGDVTDVGDCSTGACFTAGGTGTALVFKNATSGTITLQTVAGALGTITISLPAVTGTVPIAPASLVNTGLVYATAASTVADAAGLTWDNTNKILQTARSNAGGNGGYFQVRNSGALTLGNAAFYSFCVASAQCDYGIYNTYSNIDGAGATSHLGLYDATSGFRFLTYTAVNTRLYLGRAAESSGSSITTTGANAVIARTSASVPFTFVIGAGASQSTSPLLDLVSNNGSTVYDRFGPTGLVETYGSRTAAGRGLGLIMAQYKPSTLSAAVTSGNLLASAPVGTYRVSTYIHTLTVPSAACTATVTLGWTYNGGAKTKNIIVAHDLNVDENASDDTTTIDVDASTNITRAISNDGTCGTYTYDVTMVLENLR